LLYYNCEGNLNYQAINTEHLLVGQTNYYCLHKFLNLLSNLDLTTMLFSVPNFGNVNYTYYHFHQATMAIGQWEDLVQ